MRRTTSIDTTRPDGLTGRMVMVGRARDLVTDASGDAVVVGEAEVEAEVDGASRELRAISGRPAVADLDVLTGAVVGRGFRGKVEAAAPDERDRRSLLYLLLDDLSGASLVSGYALLSTDLAGTKTNPDHLAMTADLCAGWATDGSMMQLIREHGQNPTPLGPRAPRLEPADDPIAFHELPVLPPNGMRRLRRIDVTAPSEAGGLHVIDAFMRDSHVDGDGVEIVLHEYTVAATVDAATRTIVDIAATPDVLPWMECPAAVASAERLKGHGLADLRAHVRKTFVGTTTCTHLNDVLRGLADVEVLLDEIASDR